MVIGASIGAFIGQMFDGTTNPLALGFMILTILAGLIVKFGTAKS
jgi:hypothetical protein